MWRELLGSRELLANLALREIRGKYKRTLLGQGWSLLNPLVSIATFSVVFGLFLRAAPPTGDPSGLDTFALWLAAGLLPWTFFSLTLTGGMGSITANSALITKVYFPRAVIVASAVLSFIPAFVLELTVLVAALLVAGGNPFPLLPFLIPLILTLTAFAFGLSLALSIASVYFRDTTYLMALVMQLWFYFTPVVYPEHLVNNALTSWSATHLASAFSYAYDLNPMLAFLRAFRSILYDNTAPTLQDWGAILLSTTIALGVGTLAFRRFSPRLAEEL